MEILLFLFIIIIIILLYSSECILELCHTWTAHDSIIKKKKSLVFITRLATNAEERSTQEGALSLVTLKLSLCFK